MENINSVVSDNLKQLREERKLSLDALAKMSDVSKSMLGQIERGEVNPTISTVWKIASGLRISFTDLMTRPEADFELLSAESIVPVTADEGRFRNYPMFAFDPSRRFETYYLEMDEGAKLTADPHLEGTQEFLTVFSGQLEITADGGGAQTAQVLGPGCSARFKADRTHTYRNVGNGMCTLNMIIHYPE